MTNNAVNNVVQVQLDLNALLNSYNKEEFMLKVFKGFLKENPQVLVEAISNYVIMDLIKTNCMEEIANKTKEFVKKELEQDSGGSVKQSIRNSISSLVAERVKASKPTIDDYVSTQISNQTTQDAVIKNIQASIEKTVRDALYYASER